LVNGAQRAEQAIAGLRQRRVVRTADLRRINHPPDQGEQDAPAARPESVRSFSYEPTEPIDDLPKDPAEDPPLPVADPSSGLDLPTDPGLDLPDESRRLDLELRDSEEPQPSQQAEAAAASSSGEAGAGLLPEPLPQDVPIPDGDDSEADQPTIAADNTTTQSSMPEAPPQLPGLSFAERRRQHERSETSWMRSPLWPLVHDHPDPQSPGKSKRAKHHESVNIAVELFPNGCEGSTNLPAGWHYTTNGLTMRRNSRIILVNEEQSAPVSDEPWFGKTLYPLTKDAAAEFGQNYVGDLSKKFNNKTIRSRGHIWSAQASPKKKNVKDSADLKESRMSLEDRLAFIEGKKAELASIFENQVWEIELHPEKVDWNRVMKARFVLKWSADNNGNPRAKARLVLRGFSDPDLLRGELDTSSPTLSRSSRQILLAIATCKSWLVFTSDVATAFLQGDSQRRLPADWCASRYTDADGKGGWWLRQQAYVQKIKPLTLSDSDENRELTVKEVTMLRGLLGALQWPATQTSPHLSASVSLLCGEVSAAALHELCMIALSDAAWGVLENHESQGGYFVLLMNVKALQGQLDQPYVVLDWRSYKLSRISRSSLNSEAQACAGAMDALEYLLIFWHGCVTPCFELRHLDVHDIQIQSALVVDVDAKALYDSLKAEVPQMQGDRRSKIEVMVVKQKMDEMKTKLKWISSETQLADGVTKIAARQLLADRLRSHVFSLHSDQSFQAAKKKTLAERQASARRNAIGRLQKGIGFAVLTNQLEPVRGDDFAKDSFSSYNIIFIFTFLTMFVATVFLAWQCLERMTRSLPRPMAVPRFQTSRMPWSLMRPFAFLWNQQAALEDVSTQTESGRDQTIHLLNFRVQMLQQQVNDKDERIQDLENLVHYYEQDVTSTSLFVSRTGARYHLHRDCRALLQANQAGIRDLKCCSQCI
ncbi:unnamed protein product, partial [Cladocopium goreaui]